MSSASFIPSGDRIAVRVTAAEQTTDFGLVLPDSAVEKPSTGTVIAAGPGRWEHGVFLDQTFRVGETVVFSKFAGYEIDLGDGPILILTSHDVLGRIAA